MRVHVSSALPLCRVLYFDTSSREYRVPSMGCFVGVGGEQMFGGDVAGEEGVRDGGWGLRICGKCGG